MAALAGMVEMLGPAGEGYGFVREADVVEFQGKGWRRCDEFPQAASAPGSPIAPLDVGPGFAHLPAPVVPGHGAAD